MPQFVITGPDGKKYKVTGDNPGGALNALKRQFASAVPAEQQGAQQAPQYTEEPEDYSDISASIPDVSVNREQRQYNALPAWGRRVVDAQDMVNLAVNGITFGYGDKAAAGLDTLMGRGSYDDRLAVNRKMTNDARSRQGYLGMAAEIGGSVLPAARLMKAGVTAMNVPKVGALLGPTVDGAAYGMLSASGNDESLGQGALWGAGLGMFGQAASEVGGRAIKPIAARFNPDKATSEVMQTALKQSGLSSQDVVDDLARAQADGQGVYAVADALGYPGERLVSTIVRTPNDGRTATVNFLEKRQAGQGRRIATALSEGFDDPATALQKIETLKEARKTGGDINYTASRTDARNVDVTSVLDKIDERIGGSLLGVKDDIDPDTVGGALFKVRNMLAGKNGNQAMSFDRLLGVRSDISDMAFKAPPKRAGALKGVLKELDTALSEASSGYRNALQQYAKDSATINAVDIGKAAAKRGRFEDTIPAFQKLSPEGQQAFRAGYADPLIEQTQGAAVGVNKARPLISDATEAEFPAFAGPGQGQLLGRRIAREQKMFETRAAGLGGSKTADNLADEAAMSMIDPSILGNLLTLNLSGAARSAVLQFAANLKGQPASVRERLAQRLMQTDPQIVAQEFQMGAKQIKEAEMLKKSLIQALTVGGTTAALLGGQ